MTEKFVTLPEIRKYAKKLLPRDVWNFGDGGAETEMTLKRNRRAIDRLAIRQDILVDVREIDLSTSLLGIPLSWRAAPRRATRSSSCLAPRAGRSRTWPRQARDPRCSSSTTTATAAGPPTSWHASRPPAITPWC